MPQEPQPLTDLEAALRALAPAPARLDRDQLLFRAGQASVPRPGRLWPWAACLLGATAAGLAVALAIRPEPPVREVVVHVPVPVKAQPAEKAGRPPRPAPPPPTAARDPAQAAERERLGYYALWRAALRRGVERLASTSAVPGPEDAGPTTVTPPPSYYQLRVSLQTGGEL